VHLSGSQAAAETAMPESAGTEHRSRNSYGSLQLSSSASQHSRPPSRSLPAPRPRTGLKTYDRGRTHQQSA